MTCEAVGEVDAMARRGFGVARGFVPDVVRGRGDQEIVAVDAGCDPTGLLAKKLSEKVAKVVDTDAVDVQKKVAENSTVSK